jgi:rhodanese-related sulfurtransferase
MHTKTVMALVAESKGRIQNLTPDEVARELENGEVVLVDLREPAELAEQGVIAGAIHAPRGMLEFYADPASAYHRKEFQPGARTILYCASGGRSALACDTLRSLGYEDLAHLDGGLKAWKQAGKPTQPQP